MNGKILCLYPPYHVRVDYMMSLAYIMAYLRENGFKAIDFIDAPAVGMTHDALLNMVKTERYESVLISVPFTPVVDSALKLIGMIKELDESPYVVVGGCVPTLTPDLFKGADAVVVGDGELMSRELLTEKRLGVFYGKMLEPDTLPLPAWDLFPLERYTYKLYGTEEKCMPVLMSRFCPFNCYFCSNWILSNHKVYFRSVEKVVEEIKYNIKRYGLTAFNIQSENFTLRPKYVYDFCSRIVSEKLDIKWWVQTRANLVDRSMLKAMSDAGCVGISFGVEVGEDEVREKLVGKAVKNEAFFEAVKLAHEFGMSTYCSYIIGHPWDTLESIKTMLLTADRIDSDYVGFGLCTPFPKTKLRQLVRDDQIIAKNWNDFNTMNQSYIPDGLRAENLESIREIIAVDYYSRSTKRLRNLWKAEKRYFLLFSSSLIFLFLFHKVSKKLLFSNNLIVVPKFLKRMVKKLRIA